MKKPLSPGGRICVAGLLWAGLMCGPAPADAPNGKKVRLFILTGQSNMAGLNPAVSFTPAVNEAFAGDEVIVVKHALGGQPIRRWYKGWKPPAGTEDDPKFQALAPGDIYDALMAKVREELKGRQPDSIAFAWMQGESDAGRGWAPVYEESMKGLIRQVRDDLKHPDVAVVIGRLSDCKKGVAGWDAVRAAQEKVAGEDPRGAWVDTDDLNDKNGKNDLHYTKEGYAEFGKRLAAKAVELIRGKAKP